MNEQQTSKKNALQVILCVLLCCSIAVSSASLISGLMTQKSMSKLNEAFGYAIDTGKEDDVRIADEYTIRSTKQISDAYLNDTADSPDDRDKETLSMAKAVLDEIIKDGMTDYDKEEACYLWLTSEMKADTSILTVIHENNTDVDNPYGVLKNHNAVCVGYATTMRLFMQMLGIECKVIHSSDLIHSWDLIKLDDEWYHVDCYSDADGAQYRNFNLNDEAAAETHDWNHEYFPAATGTKYSYAAQHAVEIKNIYAIPKWVKGLLNKDEKIGVCKFKEKIKPEDEQAAAYMVETLCNSLQSLEAYSEDYYFEGVWSKDDNGDYLLTFCVYYYGDQEPEVDDDVRDKIEAKISSAFEGIEFYHESDDWLEEYDDVNYYEGDNIETTSVTKG